jgi:hypothetical protein
MDLNASNFSDQSTVRVSAPVLTASNTNTMTGLTSTRFPPHDIHSNLNAQNFQDNMIGNVPNNATVGQDFGRIGLASNYLNRSVPGMNMNTQTIPPYGADYQYQNSLKRSALPQQGMGTPSMMSLSQPSSNYSAMVSNQPNPQDLNARRTAQYLQQRINYPQSLDYR